MSNKVEVVNVNQLNDRSLGVVYIGRGAIFGNPFVMRDERDREEVVDHYHEYFIERIQDDALFMQELEKLAKQYAQQGYLRLGCHCAPKRCHGNIVADYVMYLVNSAQTK